MVIYFGNPYAASEKIGHPANSKFMINATQVRCAIHIRCDWKNAIETSLTKSFQRKLIGAAAAIIAPMKQAQKFREETLFNNWRRLKLKILFAVRMGGTLRQKMTEEADSFSRPKSKRRFSIVAAQNKWDELRDTAKRVKNSAKTKAAMWLKKVQGGNAGIPPPFTYKQCMWTFIGVVITLTILSQVGILVHTASEGDLGLLLPPMGTFFCQDSCHLTSLTSS